MRLDDSTWPQVLSALPEPEVGVRKALAVAFVNADDFSASSGSVWLWWPGGNEPGGRCDFDGGFAPHWGMLLVLSESALDTMSSCGESCLAGLVRRVQIKPFLLKQMDFLETAGLSDFIELLELATPKH